MVVVRGRDGVSKPLFPMNPQSIVREGLQRRSLQVLRRNTNCVGGIRRHLHGAQPDGGRAGGRQPESVRRDDARDRQPALRRFRRRRPIQGRRASVTGVSAGGVPNRERPHYNLRMTVSLIGGWTRSCCARRRGRAVRRRGGGEGRRGSRLRIAGCFDARRPGNRRPGHARTRRPSSGLSCPGPPGPERRGGVRGAPDPRAGDALRDDQAVLRDGRRDLVFAVPLPNYSASRKVLPEGRYWRWTERLDSAGDVAVTGGSRDRPRR